LQFQHIRDQYVPAAELLKHSRAEAFAEVRLRRNNSLLKSDYSLSMELRSNSLAPSTDTNRNDLIFPGYHLLMSSLGRGVNNIHMPNWKNSAPKPSLKLKLRYHIKPGDIGYLTYLHGILYAKEYSYDRTFEAYVANGLAEFIQSFSPHKDRIWLAEINDQIIGSIAVVGHSKLEAQLRWFLVHPEYRRLGIGRKLLKEALHFCRKRKYRTVFLWTTSELSAAQHLYTSVGFKRTEEKTHQIWGKTITEEKYDLHLSNNLKERPA